MDPHPIDPVGGELAIAIFVLLYLAFIAFFVLIAIGYYVLESIALSKFFAKVGVEPWIAWVPFYRTWRWLEVGGQAGWFSLLSLIPYGSIVTAVFLGISMYRTGFAFRKGAEWVVLGLFLPPVWLFLLARESETYDPELIVAAGYPRPLAGFGSARPEA